MDKTGAIENNFSSLDKLYEFIGNQSAKSFGSVQTTLGETALGNLSVRIAINTNKEGKAGSISVSNHDSKGPVVLRRDAKNITIETPAKTYSTANINVPVMLAQFREKMCQWRSAHLPLQAPAPSLRPWAPMISAS